jgi:hypothetical protein
MKTTSLKSIIGRIVAGFRLSDTSYADDLIDWIAEGMGQLETRHQVEMTSAPLEVNNKRAILPCGFVSLEAVETIKINGETKRMRLRESSDQRDITTVISSEERLNNLFQSNPISVDRVYIPSQQITEEGFILPDGYYTEHRFVGYRTLIPYNGTDIKQATVCHIDPPYYVMGVDEIRTSFDNGVILLHYKRIPLSEDGYPKVPNNENYKIALEWWGLACMIRAGLSHPLFDYDSCVARFEKYGRRAINEINYPSVDRMETVKQSQVRLIMPKHYYETFFSNSHKSKEELI